MARAILVRQLMIYDKRAPRHLQQVGKADIRIGRAECRPGVARQRPIVPAAEATRVTIPPPTQPAGPFTCLSPRARTAQMRRPDFALQAWTIQRP